MRWLLTAREEIKKRLGYTNTFAEECYSMVVNCMVKEKDGLWVGHCPELDIVATGTCMMTVSKNLEDLILAQVDYAFSNDNLDNLFHPVPQEIWKELYECKAQIKEKRLKLCSKFKKKSSLKTFVPPWIIARTSLTETHCSI